MISSFSELGLNHENVTNALDLLGVDHSAYSEDELESLSLASNLIMLQAISNKSTSVEEDLASYQIQVDITAAMQNTLNDLQNEISPSDAVVQDLVDFAESEQTYMDIDDASLVKLDYTIDGTTYETLQDLLTALHDSSNDLIQAVLNDITDGSSNEFLALAKNTSGNFFPSSVDSFVRRFVNGELYLRYNPDVSGDGEDVFITVDEFREYIIAVALQASGYLNDEVFLEPVAFASTDQPAIASSGSPDYIQLVQLYFGKLTFDYDSAAGTMTLAMSGFAGMRQMGLDAGEYFDGNSSPGISVSPFDGTNEENDLLSALYAYAYSDNWGSTDGRDLTSDDYITNDDIDSLLQSAATAIEAQSTTTEVALLTVNSGISEWGELNDVWDLLHEYIHDSLKKATDNSV